MLILHHDDPRLVALADVLESEGYWAAGVGSEDDARGELDDAGPPEALLVALSGGACQGAGGVMSGLVFGRECLAGYPGLRVFYLTPLPWPSAVPLVAGERLLRIPFTALDLAMALESVAWRPVCLTPA